MRKALHPSMRRKAGMAAEEKAASWLKEQGYRIIDRNFNVRRGEVDIVAANNEVLAFVEVRSRSSSSHGSPEETISPAKIKRIITASRYWLVKNGDFGLDIRFDVIALDYSDNPEGELRHLPGAFEAGL